MGELRSRSQGEMMPVCRSDEREGMNFPDNFAETVANKRRKSRKKSQLKKKFKELEDKINDYQE